MKVGDVEYCEITIKIGSLESLTLLTPLVSQLGTKVDAEIFVTAGRLKWEFDVLVNKLMERFAQDKKVEVKK